MSHILMMSFNAIHHPVMHNTRHPANQNSRGIVIINAVELMNISLEAEGWEEGVPRSGRIETLVIRIHLLVMMQVPFIRKTKRTQHAVQMVMEEAKKVNDLSQVLLSVCESQLLINADLYVENSKPIGNRFKPWKFYVDAG